MFFWYSFAAFLVFLATIYYYFIRNNEPESTSTSAEEMSEENLSSTSSFINKQEPTKNMFKNFYSSIVRKKSASLTELPKLLQRRHSTADFPKQVAKAAKAAKNFIPDLYRRQLSVGVGRVQSRDALPRPPTEFFEPLEHPVIPERYKPITYIKQHTRLFEFPSSCIIKEDDIEHLIFDTNQFIAEPGDPDDSIYVVLEGCLSVWITPPGGGKTSTLVRRISPGDCFFSPLSLLDIFMEKPSLLKTVSLKAAIKSKVAKYSIANFYAFYKKDSDKLAWVRPVQIIATRLLHVVLTTLHQHLGLGEELLSKRVTTPNRPNGINRGNSLKNATKMKPKLKRMFTGIDDGEKQMSIALEYFKEALQIKDDETGQFLKPLIKVLHLEENQTLFEEGNSEPAALGIVLSGLLKITQESTFYDNFDFEESSKESWSMYISPRELVGALQILTDESFYTVRAASACIVAYIDKKDVDMLIERKPAVVFPIAYAVLQRCSSFVRAIDFALGWCLLDSGEALYRKDDFSDSVFVVLSGRLRSVANKLMVEEYGKGDVLGIIEVLQQSPRATTVLAVRYSQLAKVPEGMLNFVKMQFPQVGFRLVRLLGQYYSGRMSSLSISPPHTVSDPMTQRNLHTIAVFPASFDVPLSSFTCELYHALSATTRVLRLCSQAVVERLGEEAVMERKADFRLMHWLNSQEDIYHLIIYQCDYTATNWTRRCLSQADAILIVACGNQKPPEKNFIDGHLKMNQEGIRSRKELVLLWPSSASNPTGTYEWLKGSWFSGHYHIRAPDRMFKWENKIDNEREILDYYEQNVFPHGIDVQTDFSRLARILSGNALGLVLGGGGARGGSHVGVIKALREAGIPVDIVGGTSIGSMLGGLLAMNPYDMNYFEEKAQSWFMGMCSKLKTLYDITWAYTARFTGHNFNELLQKLFKEQTIEDLWLPYFCITTDITNSEMRVHRNGPLWRYVRASMSLAVYLPPICDSEDGHYLLDGGYVNNLPADVMRGLGARTVIAVDVSSADERDFYDYGDYLNGFYALFLYLCSTYIPWRKTAPRILTSQEIQDRLAYVSSVRQLELIQKAPYCNYLRPPIDDFRTLDFPKFHIIKEVGYEYAVKCLPDLIEKNNHLKTLTNRGRLLNLLKTASALRAGSRPLRDSFTDLAAQISRIPVKQCRSLDDLSKVMDEEEEEEMEDEDEREVRSPDDGDSKEKQALPEEEDEDVIMIKTTFKITRNEDA